MIDTHARGLFITGTGTGVGKTFVTRGLARALSRAGTRVAAVKPIETGCVPDPLDALALERACRRPGLANAEGLYRAALPAAPYAVALQTRTPPPNLDRLMRRVDELSADADVVLVEGAGGLLVPIDHDHTMAAFARMLGYPLLMVAPNRLGVISHALTAFEAATSRALEVAACVLVHTDAHDTEDLSNARILSERLPIEVHAFPHSDDDDDALAAAAERTGLTDLLLRNRPA